MNENREPFESAENPEVKKESEIVVNEYGATRDSAVVVEEANRTVLLTEDKTIVIEKPERIDIVPKNRPRKVYAGMWGQSEIATVGLGMLAILAVIILVVLVVMPAQKELEQNKAERDRLETELISSRGKYGNITTTEARIAELITSVDDFETRFLPVGTIGKASLYQRINGLIGAYGLVNTTGPDYAPLQIADNRRGQETESERGRAKFQSLFPGVYVTMTVEGSYQNLRRFIREMETGNQFVVISAVELEPAEAENKENNEDKSQPTVAKQQVNNVRVTPNTPNTIDGFTQQNQRFGQPRVQYQGQPSAPFPTTTTTTTAPTKAVRGKTHGETVSLRLEMAAYFRRPSVQQTPAEVGTQY
jgi:hypothetical protein